MISNPHGARQHGGTENDPDSIELPAPVKLYCDQCGKPCPDGGKAIGGERWCAACLDGIEIARGGINGISLCAADWSQKLSIPYETIVRRLNRGCSPAEIFSRVWERARMLTHDGRTMSLTEWAKEYGIHRNTLAYRLKLGLSVAEALGRPLGRWAANS